MKAKGILVLLTTLIPNLVTSTAAAVATIDYQIRQGASGPAIISVKETTETTGSEVVKATSYQALQGSATQKEVMRLNARGDALLSYHYDDHATGEMWDVAVGDGKAKVQLRSKTGAKVEEKVIAWPSGVIVGRQIPDFILQNWQSLAVKGESLHFDLYVPFRLEVISFQIKVSSTDSTLNERTVTAEPRNWLLRKLAPSINFTIRDGVVNGSEPTIARFRGPCPVDYDGVKNQLVNILF